MTISPDKNGLNQPTTPLRFLGCSARVYPDKVGFVDGPRRITFVEMVADTQAFAHTLIDDGLQESDRVGVLAANSYETLPAQFVIPLAGGVVVAINIRLVVKEIEYIPKHSEITALFGEQTLIDQALPTVGHLLEQAIYIADGEGSELGITDTSVRQTEDMTAVTFSRYSVGDDAIKCEGGHPNLPYSADDEHDPIAINYILGTTGKPEGMVYTHRDAYPSAFSQVQTVHFNHYTVYLRAPPMFHCSD